MEFRLRPQGEAGFTLLELIIVMVLVIIMVGMAAVFFAGTLPAHRLSAEAREISSTLKHARTLTRITGQSQTVIFDIDSREYGIEGRKVKRLPSEIFIRIIDPSAGEIQRGTVRFIFHRAGFVEGGTVEIWNSKAKRIIELDPIAGSLVIK